MLKIAIGARFASVGECNHQWGRTTKGTGERKGEGKGVGMKQGSQKGALAKGKTTHMPKIGRGLGLGCRE